MAETWDHVTDVLLVGSGGGGMVAALVAKDQGCDTLIIEKGSLYGGSTAMSGGAIWAPNSHLMKRAGIDDTPEEALTYLKMITEGMVPEARLRAYVNNVPRMLKYLEEHSHARYRIVPGYPDFYPSAAGARPEGGRTIEPVPFGRMKLKGMWRQMRGPHPQVLAFGRVMLSLSEANVMMDTSMRGRMQTFRIMGAYIFNPLRCLSRTDTRLAMGNAAIGRLRLSLVERNIPIWLNTAATKLVVENSRVIGIEAIRDGKSVRIRAERGVILAAGGFPRSEEMRQKYNKQPITSSWTVACPENTGDAIRMGLEAGANLEFMDGAWWLPTSLAPGHDLPQMILVERTLPGSMIVNKRGRRFVNEAAAFTDVVRAQYASHAETGGAIPAFLIVDARFRKKYPLSPMIPGYTPRKYIENGYLRVADTLEELAQQCGIDPQGLADEIGRLNRYAMEGTDPDFNRGDSAIDRYFGDPAVKPNPCLGPIDTPPYYAIELWPGDIGTNGGLDADEHGRVLRKDGSPIEGLYAAGNCTAAVSGNAYPGAGATIGYSMVYGYIAARHAAASNP
jgi:3-oxosteroid 1-dehydrogenase